MPHNTQATTSKTPKPDTAEHFRHNATFAHLTADEFQAAKYRQILDLLRWTAHLAAAGEGGVVQ